MFFTKKEREKKESKCDSFDIFKVILTMVILFVMGVLGNALLESITFQRVAKEAKENMLQTGKIKELRNTCIEKGNSYKYCDRYIRKTIFSVAIEKYGELKHKDKDY